MAGAIKLRGGAKSGWAGTNDGNFFPGASLGRLGEDPAFFPALFDDRVFQVLNRYGRRIDAENTRPFARGRTDAA